MKWIVFLVLSYSSYASIPTDLKKYFEASRLQSEKIKMFKARLSQSEEKKEQAVGSILPTVSFKYALTEIQPIPQSGSTSPFTRTNQYNAALNLAQPIFKGGAEYAQYRLARANVLLNQYLAEANDTTTYRDLLKVYFNLWAARREMDNVKLLKKYSQETVNELRSRVKIGKSRRGELYQGEALLASVRAQEYQALRMLEDAKLNFDFLTGVNSEEVIYGDSLAFNEQLLEIGVYLDQVRQRSDIRAQAQSITVADETLSTYKAGHMPTVDLGANYYFTRTGVLQSSRWDMLLNVTLPLYRGGVVNSQMREAASLKREKTLGYEELKRQADQEIKMLYQGFEQYKFQTKELADALKNAEASYTENKKDYRFGLATNLEVIQSLNSFVDTKRQYEQALLTQELTYHDLVAATGKLP